MSAAGVMPTVVQPTVVPAAWWNPVDWIGDFVNGIFKDIILSFAKMLADMLTSAFTQAQIEDSSWTMVRGSGGETGMVWVWIWIMGPILVAVAVSQIAVSAFRRSKQGILRGFIGGLLAIPVSLIAVWLIQKLDTAMTEVSTFLEASSGNSTTDVFMKMFGFVRSDDGPDGLDYVMSDGGWMWWSPGGPLVMGVLIMLFVAIAAMILNGMMIFRSFALIVAASLAPVVIMMMPLEAAKGWTSKWAETVVGLLLAKPLTMSVLMLATALAGDGEGTVSQTMMGLIGIIIAAFMPLLAMKFVSFTAASSTSDMDQGAKGAAQSPARTATSLLSLRRGRK